MSMRAFMKGVRIGRWKKQVLAVRNAKTLDEKKKLKQFRTPAVTISGIFPDGRSGLPEIHSSYICIDIDAKDNDTSLMKLRNKLREDDYIWGYFKSISGNGLAVLFRIKPKRHSYAFNAIQKYMSTEYGIHVDGAVKDPARLRYVSYDPDCYFELQDKMIWTKELESKPAPKGIKNDHDESDVDELVKLIEKQNVDMVDNYADWYVVGQALASFGEKGRKYFHRISKLGEKYDKDTCDDQFDRCLNQEDTGKENRVGIGSLFWMAKEYKVNISNTAPKMAHLKRAELGKKLDQSVIYLAEHGHNLDNGDYYYHIWDFSVKFGKDDSTQVECKSLSIEGASKFIYHMGVRSDGKNYYQIKNNIIEQIGQHMVVEMLVRESIDLDKDTIIKWDSESKKGAQRESIMYKTKETCRRFVSQVLQVKPIVLDEVNWLEDTETDCWIPFQNTVVSINRKGWAEIPYEKLDGRIVWRSSIIKRDFKYVEKRSVIQDVLENAIGKEYWTEIQTTLGYMIHTYIPKGGGEILFCADRNISDMNDGGNGKDFFRQVIGAVRSVANIPGKSFSLNNRFAMEQVNQDTKVMWLEDLHKSAKMEMFYNMNAGLQVRKMHTNPFFVRCKVGCSLQHIIDIEGSSDRRRQLFLFFTDFYSKKGGIKKYHKQYMFEDFDDAEWNSFYSMVVDAVVAYIDEGLVKMNIDHLIELRKEELSGGSFESLEYGTWYSTESAMKLTWGDDTIISRESAIIFRQRLAKWAKLSGLEIESALKYINGKNRRALMIKSPLKMIKRKKK